MQRNELHDWSSYLLEVEHHIKRINHKLLHKDYESIEDHVESINYLLDKMVDWVKENRE